MVQAVCVSSMAQSDGVVASPSSRRHEKTVNISTVAKEGEISARTGGAAVETSIVTQRIRRNSVVFVDEVQPSDETDAIQILGEAHTLHYAIRHEVVLIFKENPADDDLSNPPVITANMF